MLALVELHLFQPWPEGYPWSAAVRRRSLEEIAALVPALTRPGTTRGSRTSCGSSPDSSGASRSIGSRGRCGCRRPRARRSHGGLAAPLVGASIGAASGLSGAAATSAGLAALGGGSLAAGGFGVAGGTAVLTGVSAFAGAGAAAGGARATRWAKPREIALEALKAAVVTRLITLDQEHDEETAKRVVMTLQSRLEEVTATSARLAVRIRELTEENEQLRSKLEAQRDEAKTAETTLQIAIDRIDVDQDQGNLLEAHEDDQEDEQGGDNP